MGARTAPRRRRVVAAVACAASILAAGCGDEPAPRPQAGPACQTPGRAVPEPPRVVHGITVNLYYDGGASRREQAGLACASGASQAREALDWSDVEPRPGVRDWGPMDATVRSAAQVGLTVLPILIETPGWAGPSPDVPPTSAAGRVALGRLAADAARRYGPGGRFWRANPDLPRRPIGWVELYNEPWFFDPDPAPYARAAAAVGAALARTTPRVRQLVAAEHNWDFEGRRYGRWLEGMYAAVPDLDRFYDALSVHPYAFASPYEDDPDKLFQARRLDRIRATAVALGAAEKPVWITEIGWSTCDGGCPTEGQQARWLRSLLRLVDGPWRSYVDAVFVYHLRDDRGPGAADDKERFYGLLRADGTAKPAWRVWQRRALSAGREAP